jgi:hypothetical protein
VGKNLKDDLDFGQLKRKRILRGQWQRVLQWQIPKGLQIFVVPELWNSGAYEVQTVLRAWTSTDLFLKFEEREEAYFYTFYSWNHQTHFAFVGAAWQSFCRRWQ